MNAALVMRDAETDSWWSIMTGEAIAGPLKQTRLKELPVARKIKWKDWKELHPDTKVLSVKELEHDHRNPYLDYFTSARGYRGISSADKRMPDKESIYAFKIDGTPYAVSHKRIEGGSVFRISESREILLYRERGASVFASTLAYTNYSFDKPHRYVWDSGWVDPFIAEKLDPKAGFKHANTARLQGFDTFWYNWSATHRNVKVLD